MNTYQIPFQRKEEVGTIIYIAIDNNFAGTILISDKIKEDSKKAISLWRKNHIKKIVLLTGDQEKISEKVAKTLQIDEYHAELLPVDKVTHIETLMKIIILNNTIALIIQVHSM